MPRSTLEATAIAPPGAMAACRNEDPATRHAVVIRMGVRRCGAKKKGEFE